MLVRRRQIRLAPSRTLWPVLLFLVAAFLSFGVGQLPWFAFALLYDGLVLVLLFSFSDWPLENAVLALTFLNPIDLGRTLLLMQLDISALMGYTGAVFESFFGNATGVWLSLGMLAVWAVLPFWRAERAFVRKDV